MEAISVAVERIARTRSIVGLFAEQVGRHSEQTAVSDPDQALTYRELDALSDAVAWELVKCGIARGSVVGLYLARSAKAVASILGILKAGAAYLPLDVSHPCRRVEQIIAHSGIAAVVVADAPGAEGLTTHHIPILELTSTALGTSVQRPGLQEICPPLASDERVHVLYTSGSSGRPKGVETGQLAVLHRLAWMWQTYPWADDEVQCQRAPLNFVDSVWELLGGLLQGVPTVVIPDSVALNSERLVDMLSRNRVTRMTTVPALLSEMFADTRALDRLLPSLRLIISSGEPLASSLVVTCRERLPQVRLLNLYGSTEVAGDVMAYEVVRPCDGPTEPIGCPIANHAAYIVAKDGTLLPPGSTGELMVGGPQLAIGYWRDTATTEHAFITNTLDQHGPRRLYRTGDLARSRHDGTVECFGRKDRQVKINGVRIEPAEVETAICEHPRVKAAAVLKLLRPETTGLVAFVVSTIAQETVGPELRAFLRNRLIPTMTPGRFIPIDTMPRTTSGKTDRRALESIALELPTGAVRGPQGLYECEVAQIWCDLLKRQTISADDDFFALGGHSLLAVQLAARLRRRFGTALSVREIFSNARLDDQAACLSRAVYQSGYDPTR